MKKITVLLSLLLILSLCLTLAACGSDVKYGYTIGKTYPCCGSGLKLDKVEEVKNPNYYKLSFADGKWVGLTFKPTESGAISVEDFESYLHSGKMRFAGKTAKDYYAKEFAATINLAGNSLTGMALDEEVIVFFDVEKETDIISAELTVKEE